METVLEQMINYVLQSKDLQEHLEYTLTTISYLIRGQKQVSEKMWILFNLVVQKMKSGDLNEYIQNTTVVLQNYLSRGGDQIVNIQFEGKNCINILLELAFHINQNT